jgi:diguanylate cyclase (GGDEF)-like protein/PAS domain S-box-containing protein
MNDRINSADLLEEIYKSATDFAIFTMDLQGRVTTWSIGAERMLGYAEQEAVGQKSALFFIEEERQRGEPQGEMDTAIRENRAADYRWHVRKDGSRLWADGVLTPIRDAGGKHVGYLKIMRDITDKKTIEEEMQRLATVDPLTGLLNRAAFDKRLAEMMALSVRSGQLLILQLLDLDRFKEVNDTLGHHAGDLLLQKVAQRMREVMRDGDLVARIGGDEFAIVQLNMPTPQAGGYVAGKLLEALSRPFQIESRQVLSGASLGLAVCPADSSRPDELLQKADRALYRAKSEGRNNFHYFTEELDAIAHERNLDLAELRRAVERSDFWLEYQPVIDLESGQTTAVEALLRCSNPRLSRHSIEYVITLAAEAGLMQRIGAWVVRDACTQLSKWKKMGLSGISMCVNLCSRELANLQTADMVRDILHELGLQSGDLKIEVTERQAIEVERYGVNTLNALREQGVGIALDDFGTGYSALSYLSDLPVNALKLDKSFLQGIPQDSQKCAVAKAIISLATTLGLEVTAEGVESNEQLEFCRREQCSSVQGFIFSRPLDERNMTDWLLKENGEEGGRVAALLEP